jgi:hypothetical protein
MSDIINGGNILTGHGSSSARSASPRRPAEGPLVLPPRIVRDCNETLPGWGMSQGASPVSDPSHELSQFRQSWLELQEILATHFVSEVPEVFEMPPAPGMRVRAHVRHVGPAPFTFIDETADSSNR